MQRDANAHRGYISPCSPAHISCFSNGTMHCTIALNCLNIYEFVQNTKIIATGPVSQIIIVKCTRTLILPMNIRDSNILSLKIIKGINWCETMSAVV